MNPKSDVTVIIPCFNDGKYIRHALNSIFTQTILPEKIIIVDDGSKIETIKVLQTLQYPLLEVIYQENHGVSVARNNAIRKANTKYIVNLDADDYFEPTFIEKALKLIQENEKIVAVCSFCRTFNLKNDTIEIIEPLGGLIKNFIIKNNGRACAIFKKNSWEQVGGFDEGMKNGYEDWEFWIAILKNGNVMSVIPEVLTHYRIKNVSRDKTAFQKYDFELRKYIFDKHKDVYLQYLDFYTSELLRINSVLKNNVFNFKSSREYKIGCLFLLPLKKIKRFFKWKF